MKPREIILAIGILAFLALIISMILLLGNQLKPQTCGCPKVISQHFVWLFIILGIIFAAALLYYLFSIKIMQKNSMIERNIKILYLILDRDEKAVIQKLVKSKGEAEQSEITKMSCKIKAHRIIKKLKEKGIIDIKKTGKTNKIILKPELKQELI